MFDVWENSSKFYQWWHRPKRWITTFAASLLQWWRYWSWWPASITAEILIPLQSIIRWRELKLAPQIPHKLKKTPNLPKLLHPTRLQLQNPPKQRIPLPKTHKHSSPRNKSNPKPNMPLNYGFNSYSWYLKNALIKVRGNKC